MIISQHDKTNSFRNRESYLHFGTFICQLSPYHTNLPQLSQLTKKNDKNKVTYPTGNSGLLRSPVWILHFLISADGTVSF